MGVIHLDVDGQPVTLTWECDTDHIPQQIARTLDFYERPLLNEIRAAVTGRPGSIVDVGAHIGNHAVWFATVMRRRTFAFEPHPPSCRQLRKNQEANMHGGLIRIRPVAVGRERGKAALVDVGDTNSGSAIYTPDREGTVSTVALDDLHSELTPVAVIKVDVEGAEVDVLEGAAALIADQRPFLYVEARPSTREPVARILGLLGYETYGVWGATPVTGWRPV